jgi:hypothetical protein
MPLQNRVTPLGELVAVPERGALMGNRGILHDDAKQIVRPWQLRRWIACVTEFKDRKRIVMTPHSYTELFFLDEATAFAAGHRPCAECRHADFGRFRAAWARAHGKSASAGEIDDQLHDDRLDGRAPNQRQRTYKAKSNTLPDGVFLAQNGVPWLLWRDQLLQWTPAGYTTRRPAPVHGAVAVVTPRSLVAVIEAGYLPSVHPTANHQP